MPTIRVEWLATRTARQRAELARRLTDAMVEVAQVPKDIVKVVFDEIDPRRQTRGGVFWSDILKKKPSRKAAAKRPAARRTAAGKKR